jgi:hypothetical protein
MLLFILDMSSYMEQPRKNARINLINEDSLDKADHLLQIILLELEMSNLKIKKKQTKKQKRINNYLMPLFRPILIPEPCKCCDRQFVDCN